MKIIEHIFYYYKEYVHIRSVLTMLMYCCISLLLVQYRVPIWLRKQIVDKHVILKRCKEELSLLVEEMTSYVYFYCGQLRSHEADITELRGSLDGMKFLVKVIFISRHLIDGKDGI